MKKFIKNKEDFICEHCGVDNIGNGYTNHCSECLWSKHVDVNPGDRQALESCGGMMSPVEVQTKGDTYIIKHKCEKCGYEKLNKIAKTDNFATLVELCKIRSK
jgi:ribosomal protein L37E